MRVNNNNNNRPSFGISKILTPCASTEFSAKIGQMSGDILALGHPCDVCHLKEIGLGRVSAVITIPGYKGITGRDSGFRVIPTIQSAIEKMVPQRKKQGNVSLADAAAEWWLKQMQSHDFIGVNRPTNNTQLPIASMIQRLSPDESSSYTAAVKRLVEKALGDGKPLELCYFGDSSVLAEASKTAGIGNYVSRANPKMRINDGIIEVSALNTAPEEIYRLPDELMPA